MIRCQTTDHCERPLRSRGCSSVVERGDVNFWTSCILYQQILKFSPKGPLNLEFLYFNWYRDKMKMKEVCSSLEEHLVLNFFCFIIS